MDHKATRLRILYILYYYYHTGSPDKPTNVKKIIEDSGLGHANQDYVNGDIIYLYDKGHIYGQFYTGSTIPATIKITPSGIVIVEVLLEKFDKYLNEQTDQSKDIHAVKNVLKNSNPEERLNVLHSIFINFPALFDEFSKKAVFWS